MSNILDCCEKIISLVLTSVGVLLYLLDVRMRPLGSMYPIYGINRLSLEEHVIRDCSV